MRLVAPRDSTARDVQIAAAVFAGGLQVLGLAESTTKTHVSRILTKLGLRSRVQAAILAQEHGVRLRPNA